MNVFGRSLRLDFPIAWSWRWLARLDTCRWVRSTTSSASSMARRSCDWCALSGEPRAGGLTLPYGAGCGSVASAPHQAASWSSRAAGGFPRKYLRRSAPNECRCRRRSVPSRIAHLAKRPTTAGTTPKAPKRPGHPTKVTDSASSEHDTATASASVFIWRRDPPIAGD